MHHNIQKNADSPGDPGGPRGIPGDPRGIPGLCYAINRGMNGHPSRPFGTNICGAEFPMNSPQFQPFKPTKYTHQRRLITKKPIHKMKNYENKYHPMGSQGQPSDCILRPRVSRELADAWRRDCRITAMVTAERLQI